MNDNITHFDRAREMFRKLSGDDNLEGCRMAVAVVITKEGDMISGVAYDEIDPRPYHLMGGLDIIKNRIMWSFIDRAGEL